MTYQPSNRRLCIPPVIAFEIDGIPFYIDDANHDGTPSQWGREGSIIKVTAYYHGRFTLVDDRGRFLKHPTPPRNRYTRRVRSFRSPEIAAAFAIANAVESCE